VANIYNSICLDYSGLYVATLACDQTEANVNVWTWNAHYFFTKNVLNRLCA